MPNCLGIYTENNIIKYAKLDSDKNGTSFKLASYGVRFSENTRETIEEIIGETNSANDELATSITSEKYELIDVFSRLNKKDIKELVITGFADACASKGLIPSVMEMKFKLSKNTGDADKYKAICVATDKSDLANVFRDFSDKKITSLAPLGTSITNILANKGIDDQVAIINIEDETVVTIIELGEIEKCLTNIDGIKSGIALIKKVGKADNICAYYTADKEMDEQFIKEELSKTLTDYMVPAYYVQLDEMPLTPNGKVNTKVLPEPADNKDHKGQESKNETERKFCNIFAEILELDKVYADDNFFDIGGISLTDTRVIISASKRILRLHTVMYLLILHHKN